MIHREGNRSIGVVLVFDLLILMIWRFYFIQNIFIGIGMGLIGLGLLILVLQFFRNPSRWIMEIEDGILSPADGKILALETTLESEFMGKEMTQVSIFMSPFNIHKNLNPVNGLVQKVEYHPGKFLVAFNPKSSTDNERCSFLYQFNQSDFLVMRQIAGAVARRIVWYIKPGLEVKAGTEMGFIKFGSRVDLFISDDFILEVNLGDKVRAGQTRIARKK